MSSEITFFDIFVSTELKEKLSELSKEPRVPRWYFGGLASAWAACITHPLDTMKVRGHLICGCLINLLSKKFLLYF